MYPATFADTSPKRPAAISAQTGETVTFGQLDERALDLPVSFGPMVYK